MIKPGNQVLLPGKQHNPVPISTYPSKTMKYFPITTKIVLFMAKLKKKMFKSTFRLCQLQLHFQGKYKCIFRTKAYGILLDTLILIYICVYLGFILQRSKDTLFPDEDQH